MTTSAPREHVLADRATAGTSDDAPATVLPDRIIARVDGNTPGPLTILIGGMHGNEPRGVEAIAECVHAIQDDPLKRKRLRGSVVGVRGNRRALAAGVRHLGVDLNRIFRHMDAGEVHDSHPEFSERREMIACLRDLVATHSSGHAVNVIDLHTFSGTGAPFSVFSDTLRNRAFARAWPVPLVLGLADLLPGTLIEYASESGLVSTVVETGHHDDPKSAQLHGAAIRIALDHAGHGDVTSPAQLADDRKELRRAARNVPPVLDILYRHAIAPDESFCMEPGFANFDRVEDDDLLARNAFGEVRSPMPGRILLPLYQPQGADGFFLARRIGRIWLRVSRAMRACRMPRLASRLPGISRDQGGHDQLLVERAGVRPATVGLLHLLGYRRLPGGDDPATFARRRHDRYGPRSIEFVDLDVPPRSADAACHEDVDG